MRNLLIPLALLSLSAPALAQAPAAPPVAPPAAAQTLQQQVETTLATAPQGTRFGLLVVDEKGQVVVAVNPDQRFIPASNTKMFVTAAAYARMQGMDKPDERGGTAVTLEAVKGRKTPDVVLIGYGDARMSGAPDCEINCLAYLADAVAAKTTKVHDVIGDDTIWPDQRWVPGMSWNNIGTDSGTAVSALNLDNNELLITVSPLAEGKPPFLEIGDYYEVVNEAVVGPPGSKMTLAIERPVNGNRLRVYGSIPSDSKPWTDRIGIDDPAHYAAWVLRKMLVARGVKVTGTVRVRHRPVQVYDAPSPPNPVLVPPPVMAIPIAALTPPPLAEDVVTINKASQNLHSQVLFRRLGDLEGTGSEDWSVHALHAVLDKAGLPRGGYDFSDGSGMSTYNRVSPRAMIALLKWIDSQPWGPAWHASLPIAGKDGTLRRRFIGTPLEGNLAAKTGTLNATNALSGTFRTASGKRFTFAFFANDVPNGASALPAMEAVLLLIAAAN
ncbi:MAG TPA: D-alanyl-D-alanine carboxypeptidase/D-alanyl-D-alanine-endopeptidase [Novosphingobium sp.]|nr:D-alanyl-D-alanine carboxypeptidase/D-alanyl-D-alanine-endopeptidase [Novosphingobium sp.]